MVVLVVVLAVVALGMAVALRRPSKGESFTTADITLVTADRAGVDCATDANLASFRCGYAATHMPVSIDERDRLRPYYTTNRRLFLVAGLFLHPALAERYRAEPPDRAPGQLRRFTAHCDLKIIGELDAVQVRWLPTSTWSGPQKVSTATVVDCKVDG